MNLSISVFSLGVIVVDCFCLPGPLEPPDKSLPSLNMTALSYSCTTLKHTHNEKGNVTTTKSQEKPVRRTPQAPTPEVELEAASTKPEKKFSFQGKKLCFN